MYVYKNCSASRKHHLYKNSKKYNLKKKSVLCIQCFENLKNKILSLFEKM